MREFLKGAGVTLPKTAGVLILAAVAAFGILLYKIGKDMAYTHRCGSCR